MPECINHFPWIVGDRKLSGGFYALFYLITIISLTFCLVPACGQTTDHVLNGTDDNWTTVSLTDAGVRGAPIAELMVAIGRGDYKNIHSVLVVKDGKLILEEYFQGYNRDQPHQIRSATKSIGSVLVGIAIDQGYIPSVRQPIYQYFKDRTSTWGNIAKAVTIKSLLTMTSGFDCDDHRGKSFECEKAMHRAGDWVDFALNLPIVHQPGEYWAYNSASLILLSEIILKTTGLPVPLFADEYLMEPLGITGFRWGFSPKGRAWLAGSASMRPRDMARFGLMCLNRGLWKDQRIVSEAWLAESTRFHVQSEYGIEYGYLWWRGRQTINDRPIEGFWAQGNGGQVIFVCPILDVVAVFTGGNFNSILEFQFMGMLINHILPAMLSPEPEKTFILPDKRTVAALVGIYRCNKLSLELFAEGKGLAGRLAGQKIRFLFEGNNRFYIPNPIFGNMNGRILRDDHGKPGVLLINAVFSKLRFEKTQ